MLQALRGLQPQGGRRGADRCTPRSSRNGGSSRNAGCSTWALTRAEHSLLVSGHWWAEAGDKPKGPSVFLREMHEVLQRGELAGRHLVWADRAGGRHSEPAGRGRQGLAVASPTRSASAATPSSRARRWSSRHWTTCATRHREPLPLIFEEEEPAEVLDEDYPPPDDEPPDDDFPPEPEPLPDDVVPDDPEMPDEADPEGWASDVDVLLAERAASMNRREQVDAARPPVGQPARRAREGPGPAGPQAAPTRCRSRRTRWPAAAPRSTPGWRTGSARPGCSTSTNCRARATRTRRRTPTWTVEGGVPEQRVG